MTVRSALFVTYWLTIVVTLGPGPALASDKADAEQVVTQARATFQDFVNDPNMRWFRDHIKKAKAVLIVPSLVKAGFIFGGSGGTGVLLAEHADRGEVSYPAFYTVGSVSYGLQIGAEVAQVVMLIMTEKGLNSLLTTKVQLGGDVSVAAGPVGAGAQAATADVIQFSRAKGVFGGLTLEGAVVAIRDGLNEAYYGKKVLTTDILITRSVRNPQADALRALVAKHLQ